MLGGGDGIKAPKCKVIGIAWLAITLIVLLCLQLKPYHTPSAFISIHEVSTDLSDNKGNTDSGGTGKTLLTDFRNVSSLGKKPLIGQADTKALSTQLARKSEGYNENPNCAGDNTKSGLCLNTNRMEKDGELAAIKDTDHTLSSGSWKDQLPSYHNSDNKPSDILLSTSKSLLSYSRPKYLPGYLSPCFHLEMGELRTLIQETWQQNADIDRSSFVKDDLTNSDEPSDAGETARTHASKTLKRESKSNLKKKVGLCLPGFFLVGIRKSGTSDLAFNLMKHQQIYSGTKEGHFFDSLTTPQCAKFVFRNWSYNLLQYLALLKWGSVGGALTSEVKLYNGSINLHMMTRHGTEPFGKYKLLGDYTPAYSTKARDVCRDGHSMKFTTPTKIKHVVPNAKIIFILRNPVSRASSDIRYAMSNHFKLQTDLMEKIHAAFIRAIRWWRKCTSRYGEGSYECVFGTCWNLSNVDEHYVRSLRNGIYYAYLEEYLRVFNASQILIVDTGTYSAKPVTYMEDHVLPFLGLEPYEKDLRAQLTASTDEKSNQNTEITFQLLKKTQVLLEQFYRPYNLKLSKLLSGRTFSWEQSV